MAELVGVLVSSCPAIPFSTLYTKQLEHEKITTLKIYNNYNVKIEITNDGKQDLIWWIRNVAKEKPLQKTVII